MSPHYQDIVKQLHLSLSLPAPREIEQVTSFKIGDHACHLTEHPAGYMLMFSPLTPDAHALTEEQNIFSQDPCKPVLGLDPVSRERVLWSRQHLLQLDQDTAHHQLEQLVHAAEQLSRPA
ncbi:Tir chaperone protein (CesT) family protein [Pseudomonas sp. LAMO17WK12:I10]|uniref:CesT family type III secretion system chaperone n=1 Tax=unclassified Pseudomonas TaxID=196821 RepID=UPI000BD87C59|nr:MULTISPECIES: CesT family type III secretion system chaperone [unclassified Pseudomonas]PXX54012.1 Tir chaperone family protein CesT [Pseudomonas sp. LAMO17WK12:I9]SNY51956.1 Tir chaperone protein (CesT) family protein [Pseudomonas sp. LAMO17WK12:I10]